MTVCQANYHMVVPAVSYRWIPLLFKPLLLSFPPKILISYKENDDKVSLVYVHIKLLCPGSTALDSINLSSTKSWRSTQNARKLKRQFWPIRARTCASTYCVNCGVESGGSLQVPECQREHWHWEDCMILLCSSPPANLTGPSDPVLNQAGLVSVRFW